MQALWGQGFWSPFIHFYILSAILLSSVTQSCPTLCDPMNCSTPGFPVHYQLPQLTETHVHWVSDAIQLFHPLSSPSSAISLSQHQGPLQWVSSSHQMAKVWSFSISPSSEYSGLISFRIDWLVGFPCSPTDSRVFSNTTVQKHQFFDAQHSLLSNSHIHTWLLEKPQLWLDGPFLAK